MESSEEIILPILENLPVLSERRASLEYEAGVLGAAALFARMNNQPMNERKGTKAAFGELEDLAKHGYHLAHALAQMHCEASTAVQAALLDGDPHFVKFQYDVVKFTKAVYRARESIAGTELEPAPKGRPRKQRATEMTKAAAQSFERLTGQRVSISVRGDPPKAFGTFLDFLRELFAALGIEASPEAQARSYLKEKMRTKKAL